ncbi:MAG TPA: hypothetical protein VLW85_08950 [Myxococcales bacterium]|nr:hypothetical protein [Myxococcales bacterium]
MRGRLHIAFATALLATAAQAKVYVEFRPRMSLMGGYDDNVDIKGTGGDSFGQAVPGLKLDIFGDHDLRVGLDCEAGIARLSHPQEFGVSDGAFAGSENCALQTGVRLSERDKLTFRTRANYVQDPFSIAQLGLLLRPGQSQIFVGSFTGDEVHQLSPRTELDFGFDANTLFFSAGDPGNGYMLSPRLAYAWKTSARSKWDLGVREQMFFGIGAPPNLLAPKGTPGGLLDEAHAALLGYTYALAPWANLTVRGGAIDITGARDTWQPTARFQVESYTNSMAFDVVAAHDLIIGPSTAGPIVGDIAEVGVIRDWEHFQAHLRLGIYRNASAFQTGALGTVGYGGEAGAAWKFTRDLRLEVAASRDAMLVDPGVAAGAVDRDVMLVRLVWEKARFE